MSSSLYTESGEAAQNQNSTAVYKSDGLLLGDVVARGEQPPPADLMEDEVDMAVKHYFEAIREKDEDIFRLYEDNKNIKSVLEASIAKREELTEMYTSQVLLLHALQAEVKEKNYLLDAQEKENRTFRDAFSRLRHICSHEAELQCDVPSLVDEIEAVYRARAEWLQGLHYAKQCITGLQAVALRTLLGAEADERWALATAEYDAREQLCHLFAQDLDHWDRIAQWQAAAEAEAAALTRDLTIARQNNAHLSAQVQRKEEEAMASLAEAEMARLEQERENLLLKTLLCDRKEQEDLLQPMLLERIELLQRRCAAAEYAWKDLYWHYYKKESMRYFKLVADMAEESKARAAAEESRAQLQAKVRRSDEASKAHKLKAEELSSQLGQTREQLEAVQRKYNALLEKEGRTARQHEEGRRRCQQTSEELEEALKKKTRLQERYDEKVRENLSCAKQIAQLKKQSRQMQEGYVKALEEGCLTAARGVREVVVQQQHAFLHDLDALVRAEAAAARRRVAEAQRETAAAQEESRQRRDAEVAEVQHWLTLTESMKREMAEMRATAAREQQARAVLAESSRLQGHTERDLVQRLLQDREREVAAAVQAAGEQHQQQVRRLEHHVAVLHKACEKSTRVIAGLRAALQHEKENRPVRHLNDSYEEEGGREGEENLLAPFPKVPQTFSSFEARSENTSSRQRQGRQQQQQQQQQRSTANSHEVFSLFLVDRTNLAAASEMLDKPASCSPILNKQQQVNTSTNSHPPSRMDDSASTTRDDNSILHTSMSKLHRTIQGLNQTPSKGIGEDVSLHLHT